MKIIMVAMAMQRMTATIDPAMIPIGVSTETQTVTSVITGSKHGLKQKETFYLRLYGVRHMVKDHSDCEKGNPAATT